MSYAKKTTTDDVIPKKKDVHFRLKKSTIKYLEGKMDEDAPSVPAAGRRIIEQKQREDEEKDTGE